MPLVDDENGWDQIVKTVVDNECVPRCQAIADAANKRLEERGHPTHKESDEPGYIVGVDGGKPLDRHDYRSTVITKTNEAMVDCAENNTLIYEMTEGTGQVNGTVAK